MNKESKPTIIEDIIIECTKCTSTEFYMTQEFKNSLVWIRCRQCDKTFGIASKTRYEGVK